MKILRKIHFWLLWIGFISKVKAKLDEDPLLFPLFMQLSFAREKIRAEYIEADYKTTSFKDIVTKFLDSMDKSHRRRVHKAEKRREMIATMSDEELEVYQGRIRRWKEFMDFAEARAIFKNYE